MIRSATILDKIKATGAGAKPYLSVTLQKEEKPLELLQSILRAMQDILKD